MKNYNCLLVSYNEKVHNVDLITRNFKEVKKNHVLVKVKYSGLNYKDALSITGKSKIIRKPSLTPGLDLSGVVQISNSKKFIKGDKVLATGAGLGEIINGGLSEYVYVPADILTKIPTNLNLLSAMQIGTAGFTAAIAIEKMLLNKQNAKQGPIIISGATGGVGSISINILKNMGYKTIAVTRKTSSKNYLKSIGADEIIKYNSNFNEKILNKEMFAGGIDNVGGEVLDWIIKSTSQNGNIVTIGMAMDSKLNTSVIPFILRGVNLLGVSSTNYPNDKRIYIWKKLSKIYKPTKLNIISSNIIELKNAIKFSKKIVSGKNIGRIIVKMY